MIEKTMSNFERENRIILSRVTNALVRLSEEELATKSIFDSINAIVESIKQDIINDRNKGAKNEVHE